jgi:hypothetical protein
MAPLQSHSSNKWPDISEAARVVGGRFGRGKVIIGAECDQC